ncbi:hypothetical protein PENSPDRAFT_670444 [Peniophora sp. CONT]|nr:hypothetical protein PENSPDRAFT_670444 [Peniophora sp. CONT]
MTKEHSTLRYRRPQQATRIQPPRRVKATHSTLILGMSNLKTQQQKPGLSLNIHRTPIPSDALGADGQMACGITADVGHHAFVQSVQCLSAAIGSALMNNYTGTTDDPTSGSEPPAAYTSSPPPPATEIVHYPILARRHSPEYTPLQSIEENIAVRDYAYEG